MSYNMVIYVRNLTYSFEEDKLTVISFIIALIKTSGFGGTGNAWSYQLLTNFVAVEKFFMTVGWVIFAIFVVIMIVIAVNGGFGGLASGGCVTIAVVIWAATLPLLEWVTWLLAKGMLLNFDPVSGIVGSGFWWNLIGIVLLSGG